MQLMQQQVAPPLPQAHIMNKRRRGLFGSQAPTAPSENAPVSENRDTSQPQQMPAMATAVPEQQGMPDPVREAAPLGASMREPFNYQGALEILRGGKQEKSNGLGTRVLGEGWEKKLAAIGGLIAGDGGRAVQNYHAQNAAKRQSDLDAQAKVLDWQHDAYVRQNEADLRAANPFTIGRNRIQFDPASGQSNVLYDGEEDFELYADQMGLRPGTQEYFDAVEDFVLRGSGPSAHVRDMELDDHRTGNDKDLEGVRYDNRVSLERLRQSNRSASEQQRQSNRMTVRRTPPARSPSRSSTRLPVVRTPAEARRLPSGTRFKTPTGAIKVVP